MTTEEEDARIRGLFVMSEARRVADLAEQQMRDQGFPEDLIQKWRRETTADVMDIRNKQRIAIETYPRGAELEQLLAPVRSAGVEVEELNALHVRLRFDPSVEAESGAIDTLKSALGDRATFEPGRPGTGKHWRVVHFDLLCDEDWSLPR